MEKDTIKMILNYNNKHKVKILICIINFLILTVSVSIAESNTKSNDGVINSRIVSGTNYNFIKQMIPNATKSGILLYYNDKSCDTKYFDYDQLYISLYENSGSLCLLICAEPFINENWFVGRSHKIWGNYVLVFDTEFTNNSSETLENLRESLLALGSGSLDGMKIDSKGNFNFPIGRCERLSK
ncbi:MAG: hypothetical protein GY714_17110 [Desulfobacterales bacterium]|nr:hypothetical protein [Desulfobacterales bacterium]MCP4159836.1 hypothetical protein [Deltaproteobacteria bacterium]